MYYQSVIVPVRAPKKRNVAFTEAIISFSSALFFLLLVIIEAVIHKTTAKSYKANPLVFFLDLIGEYGLFFFVVPAIVFGIGALARMRSAKRPKLTAIFASIGLDLITIAGISTLITWYAFRF